MFKKNKVSVGAWWVFFVLMAIPIVNIIMYLVLIFGGKTNKTLKHMLWAMKVPVLIILVLFILGYSLNPFVYMPW